MFNGGRVEGANIRRLANPFLQWEEIAMVNVGMDLGLFDNRMEITLDWFKKNTNNLFLSFAPPLEVGFEQNPSGNLGEIQNTGFEFDINGDVTSGALGWNAGINMSFITNQVVALAADGADRFTGINITRVGQEIGAIFGYQMDGLFQNWDDVYSHAYQNQATSGQFNEDGTPIYDETKTDLLTTLNFTSPGDIRYRDLNGDGIIEGENDRTIIGSTIPDFTWGFNNEFTYKGIMLSLFIQGVQGVDVYNGMRIFQERTLDGWSNARSTTLNAWTSEGSTNFYHRHILGDPNTNERHRFEQFAAVC